METVAVEVLFVNIHHHIQEGRGKGVLGENATSECDAPKGRADE